VERLYPGHSWSDGQLLIVFSSREESELSAARTERRR
jgi:hypothetical protein